MKRRNFLTSTAVTAAGLITGADRVLANTKLINNKFNNKVKGVNLMHELALLPYQLTKKTEPGVGFRIGDKVFDFEHISSEGDTLIFKDSNIGLEVHQRTDVIKDTVVISNSLINKGSKSIQGIDILEPLYLVFRKPSREWRHFYALGGNNDASYPPTAYRTQEITGENVRIESHVGGRSSKLHLPFLISTVNTSETGEGLFCAMEWSGAWYIKLTEIDNDRSALTAGVKISNIELKQGESLFLPPVHLGFFKGGDAGGTNALRRYLYENICPLYQGKPVLPRVSYDHWFGVGNNISFDFLKQQAIRASELGIEVFVVDASWFHGGYPKGVGNWNKVDRRKFPDGLEPLADFVRSLGMDFGLWFEMERADAGTQAMREHPEWFIVLPPETKNNRAHLNLALPDAQDWVIETVGNWIKRLDLRWSRWDYNIDPMPYWNAVDTTGKIQFEYYKGLYRVLDTLMKEYPGWMVESCSSGGRRIDIGTMKRAHTYWFSDHTENPAITRYMQARANRFLPGHLLNSSVMVKIGQGDKGFDDSAILSRMLGKLAFDGDIASWSNALSMRVAEWVKVFKKIRYLFVQDFYQLLPIPANANDWDAVEFVSYAGDNAALFIFAGSEGGSKTVKLHGLHNNSYKVLRAPGESVANYSGIDLMEKGLTVNMQGSEGGLWIIGL